jgi:hypothetical protein
MAFLLQDTLVRLVCTCFVYCSAQKHCTVFRLSWDPRLNFHPILATAPLYRIFQHVFFVDSPFTGSKMSQVGTAGVPNVQGIMLSTRRLS